MSGRAASRKVVVVTGASSGLGASIALESARRGYDLALSARRADRLETVAESARRLGAATEIFVEDLADPEAPERLAGAAGERFDRIDALVNNAGFGVFNLFADADIQELRDQIQVNFAAPLLLTRALAPRLIESRGSIVNIGSGIVRLANPGLGAYGATKAGLTYWNDALRRELRRKGVSVSLVELGPTRTDFFDRRERTKKTRGYHPFVDKPPDWLLAPADRIARLAVDLLERPRRRIGPPLHVVEPLRLFGRLIDLMPGLGDFLIDRMLRWQDRHGPLRKSNDVEANGRPARND